MLMKSDPPRKVGRHFLFPLRTERGEEPILQAGDLRIEKLRAQWKDREVTLTFFEVQVVHLLAENAGKDIAYRTLYDQVRGAGFHAGDGEEGYRVNVRAWIKRIREKFIKIDPGFDQIENYPGYGYRWRKPK